MNFLTETLHHGTGLNYVLSKLLECFQVFRAPYNEFNPTNELLIDRNNYLPTLMEVLRFHVKLCVFFWRVYVLGALHHGPAHMLFQELI